MPYLAPRTFTLRRVLTIDISYWCACFSAGVEVVECHEYLKRSKSTAKKKRNHSNSFCFYSLVLSQVFDRIRLEFPGVLDKIIPLKGDVGMPELGLHPDDRDMLIKRVNIVFHVAATIRFDEPLKVAVNLNTKGTDRILNLCRCMKNLVSIIHVSTAYSNADRREINETIYR